MLFFRQLIALLRKNLILKKRNFWRQTLWEFLSPLVFGAMLGFLVRVVLMDADKPETVMSDKIVMIAYTFFMGSGAGTFSYFYTCAFILIEMVNDKENRMRESLRIMNLNRWSYALSYFLTQGFFAMFTSCCLFVSFYTVFSLPIGTAFTPIHKTERQYTNLFLGF
jgi:hypothetical protein